MNPSVPAALLVALVGGTSPAVAGPAESLLPPLVDSAAAPQLPPPPDRWLLVSLQGDVGHQAGPAIKTVYGLSNPFSLEFRATGLFGERFGIGGGVGLQFRRGTGIAPAGQERPETWLWQVPIQVEGSMRLLFARDQAVVPYLRGGLDAVVWKETWGSPEGEKRAVWGVKWGVHVGGGAQFRLPFPEINWPGRLVGDPVLDDIYLNLEGWARSASNFGSPGLDLSAFGAGVGLTLLM